MKIKLYNKILVYVCIFFTLNNAYSASIKNEDKKISDILIILEKYLNGNAEDAEALAFEKADEYQAENSNLNAPMNILCDYLSGNNSISYKFLFFATEDYEKFWGVVALASFVKSASDNKLDAFIMKNKLRNFQNSLPQMKINDYDKWNKRVEKWIKWCNNNFSNTPNLEPLLESKRMIVTTTNPSDFDSVSVDELVAIHDKTFAGRPRPRGLEFSKDESEQYFKNLKYDNLIEAEERRFLYIKGIKAFLIKTFQMSPYSGKIICNGNSFKGVIALANSDILHIKKGNSKKTYKWSDIDFKAFVIILENYAERNRTTHGGLVTDKERNANAAEAYARLAILCLWYKDYSNSIKYSKKAINLDKEYTVPLETMILK